jgi:hypothetical protein
MSNSPSLAASPTYTPNLIPAAFSSPGPAPIAPLPLAQLPAAGSVQPGTSTFISDSTVAYSSAAIGNIAVGGGSNICRVFSTAAGWVIG